MQRILYKTFIISIALLFFNCSNTEEKTDPVITQQREKNDERIFVTKAQFKQNNMQLGQLEKKAFPITVKATGMIDVPPENRAIVNAIMGGFIKTTHYLVGDKVQKGDALVTIENADFVTLQQNYMEVSGQLSYLKSEYERQKTLLAEKISSEKSYLLAESNYKTALAKFNGLRKQLSLLHIDTAQVEKGILTSVITIYAPITGSITKVNVLKGSHVSQATEIMEIIDNHHIHLELSVYEKDIMKLKKEQTIEFKVPEASATTYKAAVHLIGTTIEANRTVQVHGHIENESETNFLVGMYISAEIITSSALENAIPESAIATQDATSLVFVLDEESADGYYFTTKIVARGLTHKGYVKLANTNKLNTSDTILTNGAFSLLADE